MLSVTCSASSCVKSEFASTAFAIASLSAESAIVWALSARSLDTLSISESAESGSRAIFLAASLIRSLDSSNWLFR